MFDSIWLFASPEGNILKTQVALLKDRNKIKIFYTFEHLKR